VFVKCSTNLGFILCQADQGTSAAGEYAADYRTCRETFRLNDVTCSNVLGR